MRFKQFLLREDSTYMTLEEGLKAVKEQCHKFLSDIKGSTEFLYRGMQIPVIDKVIQMDHLKERTARDSSPAYNLFFNAGMDWALDVPLVRTRSIFTTGRSVIAGDYGNVYFAFPRGEYKFVWSPDINDSYVSDIKLIERFILKLHEDTGAELITPPSMMEIFSVILQHSGDNMSRAVANLKTNDGLVEEAFLEHEIEITAEQVEKALTRTFQTTYYNNEMNEAIHSKNEILIYESDGCIFIPRELIREHVKYEKAAESFLSDYFWGA